MYEFACQDKGDSTDIHEDTSFIAGQGRAPVSKNQIRLNCRAICIYVNHLTDELGLLFLSSNLLW